jgi:mono/diheme cytochrome c family protein
MKHTATAALAAIAIVSAAAQAQQAATLNDKQLQGRQLLSQSCGVCHLQPSKGSVTYGPVLHKGSLAGNDLVMRTLIMSGTDRMPGFSYYLKPAEVDAIIAYVRTVPTPATTTAANDTKGAAR